MGIGGGEDKGRRWSTQSGNVPVNRGIVEVRRTVCGRPSQEKVGVH